MRQHTKTTLTLSCFVAVFALACGSDSHPPAAGDLGESGGTGSGGKGGASGSSGKKGSGGGHATVDGGTTDAGVGGNGADAGLGGGAANGGAAGRDASSGGGPGAGGTGSGGRAATDGGPLGDANLGAGGEPPPPPTPGTIGTGTVDCEGVSGNSCGAGTACCAKAYTISRECVTGYADCSCYAEGSCPLLGCDGPEDCPDAKCCATVTADGDVGTTWCKKDCEAVEQEVCKVASDCSSSDATCALFGSGISTCN